MNRKLFLVTVALILFNVLTFAQQTTVKGKITADDGAPLPGASVVVKGTTNGTVTDIDGNYSLSFAIAANTVLQFSYIGYVTEEVAYVNQSNIDMKLIPDISDLDEVVVVGYGTQKKSLVTGAISKLSSEDLVATQPQRVEQAIQGKVSGVTVAAESGSPGAGLTIKIRGTSSNRKSDPLFIVDGMRTGGIDYLDPADIESIEILKDAASAAIYGAEGGNGVVLITTKKGTKGTAQVTYNTYFGKQYYIDRLNVMDGDQYVKYFQDALTYENASKTPEQIASIISGKGLPAVGESAPMSTDWLDEVTSGAPILSHNLGLSGGTDKTSYSTSINYFNQSGITGGDKANFKRITARLNIDHKVNDWFSMGVKATYSNRQRKALGENSEYGGVYGNAIMIDPLTPIIYQTDADINPDYINNQYIDYAVRNSAGQAYGMSSYVKNEIVNPLAQVETQHGGWGENKIMAGAYAEFEPIKGLKFKSSYDVDVANAKSENWTQKRFFHDLNYATYSTGYQEINEYYTWQFDNLLSYSKTFANHNFSAMVGSHAEEFTSNRLTGWGKNLIKETYSFSHPANAVNDTIVTPEQVLGGYRSDPVRLASIFGRFTYNYMEKYMINFTLRNDKSSKLSPKDNPESNRTYQSGLFPSISLGWVASNEEFWSVPFLNFFKVRYSYGENGSLGVINPFEYVSLVGFAGNVYADGSGNVLQGATPAQLSNEALSWETTFMHNMGVDFRFLDSKFSGSMEYFIKTTEDLLTTAPIPDYVGNYAPQANNGNVVNKGLEFELSYKDFDGEFQYEIGGNMSFLKNEVTNYPGGGNGAGLGGTTITRIDEGLPIYYFYGYETAGVWKDQADIDANNFYVDAAGVKKAIQSKVIPGDVKIIDVNNDSIINAEDRKYIGSPHPDMLFGLNFNAFYKNFDLGINLTASVGNDVYFGVYRNDLGMSNRSVHFAEDAWSPENPNAEFFRPTYASTWNFAANDMFVEDGSYLKLKNVTIGYTLPSTLTKKIQISNLRVYVSGNNLLTVSKYHGSDPEMGNTQGMASYGVDRGFYPQARQFLAGLNVTF